MKRKLYQFKYFILKIWFLLSTKSHQETLIRRNAMLVYYYQRKGAMYDDIGDVRSALYYNSESYEYLNIFVIYCNAKKYNQVDKLKELYEEFDKIFK